MLAGYRVLDLSDEKGFLAGRILGDLGADVVKIEKPNGDAARSFEPIFETDKGKASLYWLAYNCSKRGITLDLQAPADRATFRRLAASAHFVVETFTPGYLRELGLDYPALSALNPGIIVASITPYGQTGPLAQCPASDLNVQAMGGAMVVTGDPDKPPVRFCFDQSYMMGGLLAVAGMLTAHHRRMASGLGQHVDVSLYEAMASVMVRDVARWEFAHSLQNREGARMRRDEVRNRVLWRCKDGYIVWLMFGGAAGAEENRALVQWMDEEGLAGDLKAVVWEQVDMSQPIQEQVLGWERFIEVFFAGHTVAELEAQAARRRIRLCRVYGVKDVAESNHLASRHFWDDLPQPELGASMRYPGHLFLSTGYDARVKRRPPMLGEHNQEILAGLDAGPAELRTVPGATPAADPGGEAAEGVRGALSGIRVVDFGRFGAGPIATRLLAEYGAEVIRIESAKTPDLSRLSAPFKDGIAGVERSGMNLHLNTSKLSIVLDLKRPEAVEIVKRLVAASDLVFENFAAGVMDRLGLGYDELRRVNPGIILASCSIMGHVGEESSFRGFGHHGLAVSGHYVITGWPDGEPACPASAFYADHIAPIATLIAALAAMEQRRRTGEGQHVDVSQVEPMATLIAPLVMDYAMTGREAGRVGNRHPNAAPHGTYPCQAPDTWCTIAVFDEQQWQALCAAIGHPAWTADPRFATLAARKQHEDELDGLLGAWTRQFAPHEVMQRLQRAGVPAGAVQTAEHLVDRDAQLKAREYLIPLEHPVMGICNHPKPAFRLSATPPQTRTAPCLGEHTAYVCREILRMTEDEYNRLIAAGVFE